MKSPSQPKKPKHRLALLTGFLCVVLFVYAVRLFQIQIVDGPRYAAEAFAQTTTTLPIAATRGEILDASLRPMVVNSTSYAVTIDYNYFPHGQSSARRAEQTRILKQLIATLKAAKESWNDTLPISDKKPYTFEKDRDYSVSRLKETLELSEKASAADCMAALYEKFELTDEADEAMRRSIAGVQYEMILREFSPSIPFTFASPISKKTSYAISEAGTELPGVTVELTPVREYKTGTHAAHLIGTVGLLNEEEYEEYQSKGYSYNDVIGKSGVEQALEAALRGQSGERTLVKDSSGAVVKETETVSPVPGDSVVLTLDLDLQADVETALDDIVKQMRSQPKGYEGQDISSGAAVVLDVRDNAVLACASWPSFDISTYYENYAELLADADAPLFNRALDGGFAPGSTFKPSVAIAALNENIINKHSTYYCGSWYRYFEDQGLLIHCMSNHGNADVVYAIGKSCNCFFCEMGRRVGIERMNKYCRTLGLGVKTGIEVGESAGILAGPEEREAAGGIWSPGDTSQAAIGQSDNMITPIQLATYVSTIANRGVRYKTHLVRGVLHYDGTETVTKPEVAAKADVRKDVWDSVKEGMLLTATNGTATRFFVGADYAFAAKTGTAEAGNGGSDHGVFIGYAPADNPQVAIAVVMENGTATASGRMARRVFDAYFAWKAAGADATPTDELLG